MAKKRKASAPTITGPDGYMKMPPGREAKQAAPICYQCEHPATYLFADARCKNCTRLTPEEVKGNG